MTTSTLEPGQILAGRYRIERPLRAGGMGSVYVAQHLHTDEELAVKVLHAAILADAASVERFRLEARTPARIQSEHVVRVTDADVAEELGGVPFLVMEYLRGEDLEELVERRGKLPPQEAVEYLRQASRALDKAHSLGVVHRDLKPENLFITSRDDGSPWLKLLDFGIAKFVGRDGDIAKHGNITATGQVFGTPLYMSPEQALAKHDEVGPQTDVWAFGLIAYKLLSGQEFWAPETLTHLVAMIAYEPLPVPSARCAELPDAFDAFFARCCAREPAGRFATTGEAVAALARALGVDVPPPTPSLPWSGYEPRPAPSSGAPAAARSAPGGREGASLRQSAGPLSRTYRLMGSAPPPRRRVLALAAAVGALLTAGGLGYALFGRSAPPAVEPAAVTTVLPLPQPAAAAAVPAPGPAPAMPTVEPVASGGGGADERLDAEAEPVGSASARAAATVAPPPRAPAVAPQRRPSPRAPSTAPSAAPAATGTPASSATAVDPLSGRQ